MSSSILPAGACTAPSTQLFERTNAASMDSAVGHGQESISTPIPRELMSTSTRRAAEKKHNLHHK